MPFFVHLFSTFWALESSSDDSVRAVPFQDCVAEGTLHDVHLYASLSCGTAQVSGSYPQYGWDFPEEIPEKFRKEPGNALRAFPGISLESTTGMPQAL